MREKTLTKKVGLEIRRLRNEQGLSQEDFAEECGLHRTYVGAVERGEKTVTVETAKRILNALGLSLGQFFQQMGE